MTASRFSSVNSNFERTAAARFTNSSTALPVPRAGDGDSVPFTVGSGDSGDSGKTNMSFT